MSMTKKAMGASMKNTILAFMLGQIFMLSMSQVYHSTRHIPSYTPAASSQNNGNGITTQRIDIEQRASSPSLASTPRAHRIDRATLPHKCGMVFFYHVPSTGGATINQWLLEYLDEIGDDDNYFTNWARNQEDGSGYDNAQTAFIEGSANKKKRDRRRNVTKTDKQILKQGGMNAFVTNFQQDEWRISHCHHSSLHLNVSEHLLFQWRSAVESQGCAFIANVMFRDSLSHSMSLYKHVNRFNSSREDWNDHLYTMSEMGPWQTQLDYFLYNILARNPSGVDTKTKVQRALEILKNHFDIVTVGQHDRFQKELLEMTGWKERVMKRTNTHGRDILFTKKEIEEIGKLMESNGDAAFIYEVKKLYNEQ